MLGRLGFMMGVIGMARVIGVDPGLYGAIAVVGGDGGAKVWDMPVVDGAKRVVDVVGLYRVLDEAVAEGVGGGVIEKQWAFPGQGGVSIFSLGHMVGIIEGYFVANGIPYCFVVPKTWQKYFGIGARKWEDTKAVSYQVASRYYPDVELRTSRGKILDGRCDALLIARWGLIHEGASEQ